VVCILPFGIPNLSDDGSKDENAKHEVDYDEGVFGVGDGQWKVSDGCHSQRRPEERIEVHSTEGGVDGIQHWIDAVVNELVGPEADPGAQQDEEAGVPVNDDEDVDNEVDNAGYPGDD